MFVYEVKNIIVYGFYSEAMNNVESHRDIFVENQYVKQKFYLISTEPSYDCKLGRLIFHSITHFCKIIKITVQDYWNH